MCGWKAGEVFLGEYLFHKDSGDLLICLTNYRLFFLYPRTKKMETVAFTKIWIRLYPSLLTFYKKICLPCGLTEKDFDLFTFG